MSNPGITVVLVLGNQYRHTLKRTHVQLQIFAIQMKVVIMWMHWKSISFSPCFRMQVLYLPLPLISYYLHNHNDKLKDSEMYRRQI